MKGDRGTGVGQSPVDEWAVGNSSLLAARACNNVREFEKDRPRVDYQPSEYVEPVVYVLYLF